MNVKALIEYLKAYDEESQVFIVMDTGDTRNTRHITGHVVESPAVWVDGDTERKQVAIG